MCMLRWMCCVIRKYNHECVHKMKPIGGFNRTKIEDNDNKKWRIEKRNGKECSLRWFWPVCRRPEATTVQCTEGLQVQGTWRNVDFFMYTKLGPAQNHRFPDWLRYVDLTWLRLSSPSLNNAFTKTSNYMQKREKFMTVESEVIGL